MIGGSVLASQSGSIAVEILPLLKRITIVGNSLGGIIQAIAGLAIFSGIASIVISTIGIIGACGKKRALLLIYSIVVIIIIILELSLAGALFGLKGELNENIRQQLLNLLRYYEGNVGDETTMAFNYLFYRFQCCGINAITFTNDFVNSAWGQGPLRINDQIPRWCCRGATPENVGQIQNIQLAQCARLPTPANAYVNNGCYDTFINRLVQYQGAFIAICVIILIVEVIAVIFSCMMARQVKNEENDIKNKS